MSSECSFPSDEPVPGPADVGEPSEGHGEADRQCDDPSVAEEGEDQHWQDDVEDDLDRKGPQGRGDAERPVGRIEDGLEEHQVSQDGSGALGPEHGGMRDQRRGHVETDEEDDGQCDPIGGCDAEEACVGVAFEGRTRLAGVVRQEPLSRQQVAGQHEEEVHAVLHHHDVRREIERVDPGDPDHDLGLAGKAPGVSDEHEQDSYGPYTVQKRKAVSDPRCRGRTVSNRRVRCRRVDIACRYR